MFGGIIGILVDVATSNVSNYSEEPVMVYLRAIDESGRVSEPYTLQMVPNS